MAILNTNQITLSDSGLTLDSSFILTHDFLGSVRKVGIINFACQVHFFQSPAKWLAGVNNGLKVEGFTPKLSVDYDAATDIKDMLYWFDLRLKDYLLEVFPEWDADKLILTTEPPQE